MSWWKTATGDYVNSGSVLTLVAGQSIPSTWWIYPQNTSQPRLNAGPYATQADAQEAIRKLVGGIDPSTIV